MLDYILFQVLAYKSPNTNYASTHANRDGIKLFLLYYLCVFCNALNMLKIAHLCQGLNGKKNYQHHLL
jgi:hypothetical protein